MTDEDTLVLPWAGYPWRGSGANWVPTPDAAGRVAAAAGRWASPAATLGGTQTPPDVTAAGLAWLAGERTPFGAAVIGTAMPADDGFRRVLADSWIIEHGLPFAARACLELAGLLFVKRSTNPAVLRVGGDASPHAEWHSNRTVAVLARVREAMAAAPDDEYQAAVAALAEGRAASPRHRVVASFLAPGEPWLADTLTVLATTGRHDSSTVLLAACARDRAELDAVFRATGWSLHSLESSPALLASVVGALGPDDALDLITGQEQRYLWHDWEGVAGLYLPLIAALPTDRAYRYLLGHLSARTVPAAARAGADRFPRRAARLLAAEPRPTPRHLDLLRRHVRAHPELAAALPPELAARFAPRDEPVAAVLPPVLATPPWTVRRKRTRPPSVDGLHGPDRERWVAWLTGPRAAVLDRARREPERAARALIPIAFGPAGPERRQATAALHTLAAEGHRGVVLAAAAGYGPAAATRIEPLLAADPLDALPTRIPELPAWLDVEALEPIRTPHGVLPDDAVRHVLTMLMISKPGEPYAGLDLVRQACDAASLGAFVRSLLQAWLLADAPAKEPWPLDAQAVFGDDVTATELAAQIRAWPAEGAHTRAVRGVDALARIGTETALRLLHEIATTMKTRTVRERAVLRTADVAGAIGMTPDGLADRLTPVFGLGPDATFPLDFGSRTVIAGFDAQLRPWVADATGRRLRSLPKAAAADDAELAAAAHKRFAEVKKGVRKVAADVVRRLESALAEQRPWTGAELRALTAHPLLFPVGARLLWVTADGTAFRIAEDRTFADAGDAPVPLDDDAEVRLAHPALGIDAAWPEIFADYEIVQPFPQLGREVFTPSEGERTSGTLTRFDGVKTGTGRLLGLERSGWRRISDPYGDGGRQHTLLRDLPGGRRVEVDLNPGIPAWQPASEPDQAIESVRVPLGTLSAVETSELIRDLTLATS
ncbi:DUF4132 domain-containing protein [Catenuloplanes indicus]|uniref:DUF4132 domain-containing protein n=1 Tax=Catenuloplanes indicus TaxID=137267 RepID=A0AAE3VUE6_9ACTN|nr:DUF4132 domain-containing protein [Catenuloplanes indicus]MDQ0363849.1 hypothetical protein [Catenuloplanes indicus]